jgi:hypothetical protein
MLKKTYSHVGVFPDYGNVGTQLNVDSVTGCPTSAMPQRRNAKKIMRIRHALKGAVKFYSVTHLNDDMLITISDEAQTRYYWHCNGKRYIYTAEGAVRGYEEGWRLLYEHLVFDRQPKSSQLFRALARFFIFALDYERYGEYRKVINGMIDGKPCSLSLEVCDHTPPGYISVTYPSRHGQDTQYMGISTPLLNTIGILTKVRVPVEF